MLSLSPILPCNRFPHRFSRGGFVSVALLPLLFFCLALAVSSAHAAGNAVVQLKGAIDGLNSSKGLFIQETQGRQTMSGEFAFARPGRFIWRYQKPYEQLLQSDGDKLYVYDPDLRQVTVQDFGSYGSDIASSPASILFLGLPSLEKNFVLAPVVPGVLSNEWLPGFKDNVGLDQLSWVAANPRESGQFRHVLVGLRGNEIAAMLLEDSLQQKTLIRFSKVVRNPVLPPAHFRFTPPAGVDVVAPL